MYAAQVDWDAALVAAMQGASWCTDMRAAVLHCLVCLLTAVEAAQQLDACARALPILEALWDHLARASMSPDHPADLAAYQADLQVRQA